MPKVEVKEEKEEEITHETNDWGLCLLHKFFFGKMSCFSGKDFVSEEECQTPAEANYCAGLAFSMFRL